MFLLDDIFLAPLKGLAVICQKVHEAAQEDLESQEKEILADLADLHQQLDTLKIGEQDFDARECELLDRLDACQRLTHRGGGDLAEGEAHGQDTDDGR